MNDECLTGAPLKILVPSMIGAMVGSAIPKERAAEYERAVRDGDVVLSARARDERHAEELEREMTSYGGRQIFR